MQIEAVCPAWLPGVAVARPTAPDITTVPGRLTVRGCEAKEVYVAQLVRGMVVGKAGSRMGRGCPPPSGAGGGGFEFRSKRWGGPSLRGSRGAHKGQTGAGRINKEPLERTQTTQILENQRTPEREKKGNNTKRNGWPSWVPEMTRQRGKGNTWPDPRRQGFLVGCGTY